MSYPQVIQFETRLLELERLARAPAADAPEQARRKEAREASQPCIRRDHVAAAA